MKTLKRILLGLAALLLVLAGIGLLLPRSVTVERAVHVDVPAATVFTLINGFSHFNKFSPWHELDPNAEHTYSGPRFGVGATMEWHSDEPSVGDGRQEVIESVAYEQVVCTLVFGDSGGDQYTALSSFWLKPDDTGTLLTWRFETDFGYDIIGRYVGLLMDGMIGADFEKGLAKLKALAESYPPVDIANLDVDETEFESQPTVYIRRTTGMEQTAMHASMTEALNALLAYLQLNEIEPADDFRIVTRAWNEEEGSWTYDAAIPIPADATFRQPNPAISRGETHAGTTLHVTLEGADQETSAAMYEKVALYIDLHGYEAAGDPWESYRDNPMTTPPEELVTDIYFPVTR